MCETRDGDERVALLAPETFMNESGRSVSPAMRFYKLPAERLVVVHDELDLPLGDIRAKSGGGLAGHNGLRSVVQSIGTQDFLRVRIGIGRPERGDPRPVADWVLQPFAPGHRRRRPRAARRRLHAGGRPRRDRRGHAAVQLATDGGAMITARRRSRSSRRQTAEIDAYTLSAS